MSGSSFEEAMQQPIWVDAMVEEYHSIVHNNVCDVVLRPEDKSVVEEIDYDEKFSHVARYSSVRSILELLTQIGWKIHQMDVKTTFLNGMIEEEVYIDQPEGFETFNYDSHVCRLKRALNGLKQAPYAWYTRIDNYFTGLGFTKTKEDVNLYHIVVEGKLLIIALYVDDLILTSDGHLIKYYK
eukprot:PITA_13172